MFTVKLSNLPCLLNAEGVREIVSFKYNMSQVIYKIILEQHKCVHL